MIRAQNFNLVIPELFSPVVGRCTSIGLNLVSVAYSTIAGIS